MHAKNKEPRARRWTQWVGPALTALIAALSQWLSNTSLRIPNPPAFLVLSIVFSAFQGGLASGLLSAVVAWAYVAFFFSNPGQPFVYSDENLRRVIVWAVTMPATAALVGLLQRRAVSALAMARSHAALQEEIAERQRTEAALRESEAMFQALFEFAPDAIVAVNRAGNIVRVNAQAETMFGYRHEELHGQPVERLLPERFTERHAQHRAGYVAEPRARPMGASLDLYGRRKDGREFPADITLGPLETNGDVLVLSVIRDITERKWAEREIRLLQTITVAISQAGDLNAGLGIALRQICETTGWILGEAWIPSADGSALECSPAWHGQVAGLEKFRAASEGLTFRPGAGFPGRVWVSKQPVWAQDVTTDLSFHRAGLAREAGLKAGIGFPVVTDGDVMAAMIFFAFERREEDERLGVMVSAIASQLGLVIQRRRAEEALRRSEAGLAEAQHIAHLGNWDWNIATNELYWSDEIYRIFGLTSQSSDVTYEAFLASVHPDDREFVKASTDAALREKQPYSIDHRIQLPEGQERIVHEQARVAFDEAGRPVRMVGTVQDITDRKRVEQEIRLLQTLTQAISEAEDFPSAIETVLRRICETTGWVVGEVWIPSSDGSRLECHPAGYSRTDGLEKFQQASAGHTFLPGIGLPGRVWTSQQPVWVRDVTVDPNFPRAAIAREAGLHAGVGIPILAGGKAVAVMDFFIREAREEDERLVRLISAIAAQLGTVFRRRQAEETARQTLAELARSNAELEQFAYVASHDLQEPLRGIAGTVQLLQQRYQGRLDARADEFISHAVEGTHRMQALINDLLAYSRVGMRGKPFAPADCAAVLAGVLADLNVALQESGAVVTHAALPSVRADATQLMQLFQNLIANAIKFRGERPPEIRVGAERGAGEWVFSVRDNGIGIEPQYFERVFGVFQRLHTRREYPGTGIGLAICKKIVERHGGRIWVESQPGQGSTFYFTLPDRK